MSPTRALVRAAPAAPPVSTQELAEQAHEYLRRSKTKATRRAYSSDWADFTAWCQQHGRDPLPSSAETLILYLTDRARTLKVATLGRRISAISQAHRSKGYTAPIRDLAVEAVWAGIRRTHGVAQHQVAAAVTDDIRRMVETLDDSPTAIRDRALILVGFAGAYRRSELVSFDQADVQTTREGLVLHLRRSKTDQEGEGTTKGLPYGSNPDTCPVRAVQDWQAALRGSGHPGGPLFRSIDRHGNLSSARLSDKAVALVVKKLAEAAGLDAERYSGHSLRAGFATSAGEAGVEERHVMKQTGHKTQMMVRRYMRDGGLFRDNAAGKVGL